MSLPTMYATHPTPLEVAAALMASAGVYIEFRYKPLFKPSKSPSAIEKREDEVHIGPPDMVKAFIDPVGGDGKPPRPCEVKQTKDGNWVVTLHTMNRRKKQEAPNGVYAKYGYEREEYLPRCYRMEGIRLGTLMINAGPKGKRPLFPMAHELEKQQAEAAWQVGPPPPTEEDSP